MDVNQQVGIYEKPLTQPMRSYQQEIGYTFMQPHSTFKVSPPSISLGEWVYVWLSLLAWRPEMNFCLMASIFLVSQEARTYTWGMRWGWEVNRAGVLRTDYLTQSPQRTGKMRGREPPGSTEHLDKNYRSEMEDGQNIQKCTGMVSPRGQSALFSFNSLNPQPVA